MTIQTGCKFGAKDRLWGSGPDNVIITRSGAGGWNISDGDRHLTFLPCSVLVLLCQPAGKLSPAPGDTTCYELLRECDFVDINSSSLVSP